jgi:hypothetical protein
MNCLSWIVGHLATQEQGYWLLVAQGPDAVIHPELNNLVGYGKPASTPPLVDMWASWNDITQAADRYLDSITTDILETHFEWRGRPQPENVGTLLLRNIYHYWFHIGEAHAIRQQLGHENLPEFVGDLSQVPYRPE